EIQPHALSTAIPSVRISVYLVLPFALPMGRVIPQNEYSLQCQTIWRYLDEALSDEFLIFSSTLRAAFTNTKPSEHLSNSIS
ncbi:hypothetical protein ACJMK2_030774, partial [Sinanodonta woodiana]